MAGILDLLGTIAARKLDYGGALSRLGQEAYSGFMLPSDVYAGRVDPLSPQGIARTNSLAGFMVGTPGAPSNALGSSARSAIMRSMEKTPPSELYHVVPEGIDAASSGLQSLYKQHGNAAYDMFAERWPEGADMGQYHAHKVMFYDDLKAAQNHVEAFGGKIVKVDPS